MQTKTEVGVTANEIGEFRLIPKHDLKVDHTYQRERLNPKRIGKMEKGWSWVKCGTLTVSERTDGSLWVTNGQNRLTAALKIPSIQTLPCMVHQHQSLPDEAMNFVLANEDVSRLNIVQKFKGRLVALDEEAIALNRMAASHGYRFVEGGDTDGTVRCLEACLRHYRRYPAIADIAFGLCATLSEGKHFQAILFESLCLLEAHMQRRDCGSLAKTPWWPELKKTGLASLLKAGETRCVQLGAKNAKNYADGIAGVLNYKKRNRIPTIFAE